MAFGVYCHAIVTRSKNVIGTKYTKAKLKRKEFNELLNNNKYRKIYESIIRAEILERLDAAKIECYYCERGYCCGCEIQEIRQEAYELGLAEDPCIVCPL